MTKASTSIISTKKPPSGVRRPATPSKKKKNIPSPAAVTFSTTPEVKGQGGKVSTPTADGSLFVAPGGVDVSAIGTLGMGHQYHSLDSTPGLSNG